MAGGRRKHPGLGTRWDSGSEPSSRCAPSKRCLLLWHLSKVSPGCVTQTSVLLSRKMWQSWCHRRGAPPWANSLKHGKQSAPGDVLGWTCLGSALLNEVSLVAVSTCTSRCRGSVPGLSPPQTQWMMVLNKPRWALERQK